jgi:transposase
LIILQERPLEVSDPYFFQSLPDNTVALRQALRYERAVRKAEAARLQAEIEELKAENKRLKESRRGATEVFSQEKQAFEQKIRHLKEQLEDANKRIAWFQKEYFGRKTETAESLAITGNEIVAESLVVSGKEAEAASTVAELLPQQQEKRKRGQQPGPGKGHGRSDRSNLEHEEEFLDPPNCACGVCSKPYRLVEATDDSEIAEIKVRPYVRVIRKRMYVSQCDCKGKVIVKALPPPKLYPRTTIGNSLWVYLLVWKYIFGVPTHRVLQELSLQGLHLSAGTVTGGMTVIDTLLLALYEQIVDHCRGADLWNADESRWRVFEEDNGARNGQQWWFWLFASMDAIVYLLDQSRSKEVPKKFFTGSAGVLLTDRLKSYKDLNEAIKNAWCWVHQRRDILELFQGIPSLKEWSQEWLTEIGTLFALNHKRVALWQSNQGSGSLWEDAQAAVEQQIKRLEWRWQLQLQEPDLHKEQKTVLNSFMTHWIGLTLFLTDPRIPLDNNRAERLLRSLVINRKNSYGSGKEWSGNLAAKLFTVFQTWLVNGLNPEALLLDYFNECSKTPGRPPPDVSEFLPWLMSEERKQKFKLPKNIKRPA